ncbi:hypothetical protein BGZ54_009467, partial [Gamsiella multidivaricata]
MSRTPQVDTNDDNPHESGHAGQPIQFNGHQQHSSLTFSASASSGPFAFGRISNSNADYQTGEDDMEDIIRRLRDRILANIAAREKIENQRSRLALLCGESLDRLPNDNTRTTMADQSRQQYEEQHRQLAADLKTAEDYHAILVNSLKGREVLAQERQ